MIVDSIADIGAQPIFVRVRSVVPHLAVHLKVEALNIAGSIKLKTAKQIVQDLEAQGVLRPGSRVIESSSGNLGVALAFLCAERGYGFTCVSDPNLSPVTGRLIRALGGRVIVVREKDAQNGYLKSRLELIKQMVAVDVELVWTNQYANRSNPKAHYLTTAHEILAEFPTPDWVFIGAGTTGTLAGTARCLRERAPHTRIIAVDSVGSVTFGNPSGPRYLPGMGTSFAPELAKECVMDELVLVKEADAVRLCRRLARGHGLLLGPSSGSVMSAVASLGKRMSPDDIVVAISPDMGDRYLETLYSDEWIGTHFPAAQPLAVLGESVVGNA